MTHSDMQRFIQLIKDFAAEGRPAAAKLQEYVMSDKEAFIALEELDDWTSDILDGEIISA